MVGGTVRAVLWDADGVLQQVPASWFDLLGETIGTEEAPALLDLLIPQMEPAISGEQRLSGLLPRFLDERGLPEHHDRVSEVWGTIDALQPALDLGQLALVDDTRENVEAARSIGLHAVLWHDRDGIDVLRAALRDERLPL